MSALRTLAAVLLGVLIAGNAMLRAEALRKGTPAGHHLLYLPSGRYLKVITFGYEGLAADLIYIWSIQYYSNYQIQDRYDYLDQIYRRVIAELDPHFVDPFLVGSMIMSVEAGRDDLALTLLDDGMAKNPGEWILPFQAGFLCYQRLHDYARARDYFERALKIPGAPAPVKRIYAEMYNRLGDRRASLRYWSEIHDTAGSDYIRRVSFMHVHDLAIQVALEDLSRLVEEYRRRHGEPPPSLEALVREGMIAALPRDPEGNPFRYDPRSGQVRPKSRFLLGR